MRPHWVAFFVTARLETIELWRGKFTRASSIGANSSPVLLRASIPPGAAASAASLPVK